MNQSIPITVLNSIIDDLKRPVHHQRDRMHNDTLDRVQEKATDYLLGLDKEEE